VLQGVTMLPTSDEVWFALDDMYASHIQARLANTRIALCHKQGVSPTWLNISTR
jgi:hypothetical protein